MAHPYLIATDTTGLDQRIKEWKSGLPEGQRDGQAPTLKPAEGSFERMKRSFRPPKEEENSEALETSLTFGAMAKRRQINAVSSHNDRLVKQLNDAMAIESNPVARKFLQAMIKEVKKR